MPLASAISSIPHLAAFEQMAEQSFAGIDKTVILMYMVDIAPADALPYLAEQLDVLGYRGWLFAETETERRDLLKKAITLHKKKGTPFAIREALWAVHDQYQEIEIIKAPGVNFDGTEDYDGNIDYAGGFWANFIVRIHVPNDYTVTDDDRELAERIIEEYKNARSQLILLEFWKSGSIVTTYEPAAIIDAT